MNWGKLSCAFLGTLLPLAGIWYGGSARAQQKTVSIGDCSFTANRNQFLAREGRIRLDMSRRASRLNRMLALAPAPPQPASSIPRRNFIDDAIFSAMASQNVLSARLTTDEEFFRRIHLDLVGHIPDPQAVRGFVADTTPTKRDDLIDNLLYSPEFSDRWTMWLGDLLQNTAASANFNRQAGGRDAFYNWMKLAVDGQKSLKDLAYECIIAAGNSYDATVGNANFVVGMTTPMGPIQDTYDTFLARSASMFLGLGYYDCLLCHSGRGHLDQISLWGSERTRAEAEQMAAFFSRVRLTRSGAPVGDPLYLSTFVWDAPSGGYDLNTTYGNRPNRTAIGSLKTLTPQYRTGEAPGSGMGWRDAFATFMTADPMFARNFANRIWKQLFNLGLVDPVDTMDPERLDPANPPPDPWTLQAANPALLERLAAELVRRNFNLREFIRVVVESSAYQLSSRYDGNWDVQYVPLYARHYPRRLEGEEVADAIVKATGVAGSYTVAGWPAPLQWAMQLPDTVQGGGAAAFMNVFFRGNRDTQPRNQAGSVVQQLTLMNDPFVLNRTRVTASPVLQAIAKTTDNSAVVEQMFLTFLSRFPTDDERQTAVDALSRTGTQAARNAAIEDLAWVLINKLEFLFSY